MWHRSNAAFTVRNGAVLLSMSMQNSCCRTQFSAFAPPCKTAGVQVCPCAIASANCFGVQSVGAAVANRVFKEEMSVRCGFRRNETVSSRTGKVIEFSDNRSTSHQSLTGMGRIPLAGLSFGCACSVNSQLR